MDDGNAETGFFGVEINADLAYITSSGLSIEARIRRLLAHEHPGIAKRGASLTVRYALRHPGGGLALALALT